MFVFKRPIFWALWVLVSTIAGVWRVLPELTARGPQPVAARAVTAKPGTPQAVLTADARGHHRTFATVDGRNFQVMVDTGASFVALTEMDAGNLGFRPRPQDFTVVLKTANGEIRGARYLIPRLAIGEVSVRNVEAVVLPRGALGISLLGQSFLRQLSGYELAQGKLILRG